MFDETPQPEAPDPLWYCPIQPWLEELHRRISEAHALNTNVVNLSYTHPRGFFPPIILRRKYVREYVKTAQDQGWIFDTNRFAPQPAPDRWFTPAANLDLNTCDLKPFQAEISRREDEAAQASLAAYQATGRRSLTLVDLTSWHPRGGIPNTIMARLNRRKDKSWIEKMGSEIQRLYGEANKLEATARTQREKAQGFKEMERDPSNYLAAAEKLDADAAAMRAQARFLKSEIGEDV